jgi:predicted NBD/HSP70 family sugar kinase
MTSDRSTPPKALIGIDLGGTKIEAAVLLTNGPGDFQVRLRQRIATEQEKGYDNIVAKCANLARKVAMEAAISLDDASIGVGMPGSIQRTSGLVKNSNTTCLNGRAFRQDLSQALTHEIVFDNDANCFALAEAQMGAGKAYVDGLVFGVIMGTGVGGGWVVNGKVWDGLHGIAGEWGHHEVYSERPASDSSPDFRPCYCGRKGCLETYASGPAVEKDYARRSGQHLKLAQLAQLAAHDHHAKASLNLLIDAFGRALANVINIMDPSAIVLGGGVSNLDILYTEGRQAVKRHVFNDELLVPIVKHELGDSAGVLGAALLAR